MRSDASNSFETHSVHLRGYDSLRSVSSHALWFLFRFVLCFMAAHPAPNRQKRLETLIKFYSLFGPISGTSQIKTKQTEIGNKASVGFLKIFAWDIKTFISIQITSPVRRFQKQTHIELIVQLISKFLSSGSFRFTATSTLLPAAASTSPQHETFIYSCLCFSFFCSASNQQPGRLERSKKKTFRHTLIPKQSSAKAEFISREWVEEKVIRLIRK